MSVAAIYELPECLEIACEAMRDAKRPSFLQALPGMSQIEQIGLEKPVIMFRCCGNTHVGQTARLMLNSHRLRKTHVPKAQNLHTIFTTRCGYR